MTTEAGFDVTTIAGTEVRGIDLDDETRCSHYDSERDVIAIRFPCCGVFYPCFRCHAAVADHEPEVWPADARDAQAILCGVCGAVLNIEAYLSTNDRCSECDARFNPGCANHYDRYFGFNP